MHSASHDPPRTPVQICGRATTRLIQARIMSADEKRPIVSVRIQGHQLGYYRKWTERGAAGDPLRAAPFRNTGNVRWGKSVHGIESTAGKQGSRTVGVNEFMKFQHGVIKADADLLPCDSIPNGDSVSRVAPIRRECSPRIQARLHGPIPIRIVSPERFDASTRKSRSQQYPV